MMPVLWPLHFSTSRGVFSYIAVQPGVPLELRIAVLDKDCRPLNGTFVDIWSCNSTGVYSGWVLATSGRLLCQSFPKGSSNTAGLLHTF